MWNTTNVKGSTQSININAVSGSIIKNHTKSWFRYFHLNSPLANEYLTEDKYKKVIVLQMVLVGDGYVVAECMTKEDYDEMIKLQEGVDPKSEDEE